MNTSRLLAGFCVALLSVVILWGGNGAQSDQPPEQWYVSNEVLIVFSSAYRPAAASLSCVNGRFGVREVDSVLAVLGPNRIRKVIPFANERHSGVGETLERTYTFHYDSDIAPPVLAAQLSRLPYFDDVRVNHLFHREYHGTRRFHVSDTTYFAEQWNLDSNVDSIDIDAPEAWAIQQGSSEVILCIIDSGTMLDTTDSPWQIHSDFHYHWISEEDSSTVGELSWEDVLEMDDDNGDDIDDNIIGHNWDPPANHHTEQQLAFWRAIPNNYQIYPDTGWGVTKLRLHGLWVASIAAAALEDTNYVGVAHNCEVYILRDGRKTVNEGELIEMLDHASTTASVINMSWGIHEPDDSITAGMNQAILRAAQDHDCVLVASAGNDESSSLVSWPARNPNVLGVGSIGRNLAWEYYSNYGAEGDIDVVAIGDTLKVDSSTECADISGFPRCPTDLEEKRDSTGYGTSFAAPQAAGVAALIRSQFPSLTQDEVRDRIKRSSIFYWADTSENRKKYGAGYINAYRALTEWGELTTSTTWNPTDSRDSTLYVSGDLVIPDGVSLTINAGTTIKLAPDNEHNQTLGDDSSRVEIIVKGTLEVAGTSANPVVFESFTDSPSAAGDWVGIRFDATSEDNSLEHVVIKHAQKGIVNYAPVTLSNVTIDSCSTAGIEAHDEILGPPGGSDVTIKHTGWGILSLADIAIDGYSISDCVEGIDAEANAEIKNSTFSNNSSYGIDVQADTTTLDGVTIEDCPTGVEVSSNADSLECSYSTITGASYHGIHTAVGSRVYGTTIRDCYNGIYFLNSYVEIDSCLLVNNDTGIYAAQYTDGRIYKCVVDSSETNGIYCLYNSVEIETDTLRYGETGLSCYAGGNPVVSGGGWFKGNSAGIKCDYYSSPTIDVTKVTGSTNGVIAIDHSEPDLAGSGNDPCVGNSLHHNTVDVSNLDSTITIDATRVYWGSSTGPDPGSIYGSVDYLPYCTSDPLPSPPGPPPGGGDQPGDKVPVVYSLSYNYPNPFNPTTTLRYDVPRPGTKVEIVVYNIRGQRVRTLVSEMRAPGVYQTEWNGLDESGSPVASGVYFVRMKAGTFTNTKKLVLIK